MQSTQNYLMLVLRNKKNIYKDSYTCTCELGEAKMLLWFGQAADSASFEWSRRDLAWVCMCVNLGSHSTNTAFAILIWNYPRPILMLLSLYPKVWKLQRKCIAHTSLPTLHAVFPETSIQPTVWSRGIKLTSGWGPDRQDVCEDAGQSMQLTLAQLRYLEIQVFYYWKCPSCYNI